MSETRSDVREVALQALSGRGAHVLVRDSVDGLDWRDAGRKEGGYPHTVYEIVRHMEYWQQFGLAWIDGGEPEVPEHAAGSWPGPAAPADEAAWEEARGEFLDGLSALEQRARESDLEATWNGKSVLEVLHLIASHNSYHCGQIAQLRRQMGSWPPPGGGATW